MRILVGHTNMDLDCLGSMVLAKYLYPDHVPVRSHLIHPVARNVLNLYENRIGSIGSADLKGETIEHMVVVDTRSTDRVAEFLRWSAAHPPEIEVWDHHPPGDRDIPGATIHERAFGSNTTQLGLELMKRGILVDPEDATIALTGIYADTGNFTHPNVVREDFDVAAYLLERGALLSLVKEFLVPLKEKHQLVLFHEVLNRLEVRTIRGHLIQTCYLELDEDAQGLGAVVEQVFEIENAELFFGFFYFKAKKKMLIIARNKNRDVCLNDILADFGGGGHRAAASATVKTEEGKVLFAATLDALERFLEPEATAADIMTEDVAVIGPELTLLEASKYLEKVSHTGLPVVDAEGEVLGFITLRDIMVGRKAGQMHVKVDHFMSRDLVSLGPEATVRTIEETLFERNIGHLPILRDGRLVGIVTRSDYLAFKRGMRKRREDLLAGLGMEMET